jgi:hypothetical protein
MRTELWLNYNILQVERNGKTRRDGIYLNHNTPRHADPKFTLQGRNPLSREPSKYKAQTESISRQKNTGLKVQIKTTIVKEPQDDYLCLPVKH